MSINRPLIVKLRIKDFSFSNLLLRLWTFRFRKRDLSLVLNLVMRSDCE